MNDQYIIGTTVRMADFIKLKTVRNEKGPISTTAVFNRISGKHSDFIICTLNGKPLAWIELDDRSHNSTSARKADAFKHDVASYIGLPLHRVKTGTNYNEQIMALMGQLS